LEKSRGSAATKELMNQKERRSREALVEKSLKESSLLPNQGTKSLIECGKRFLAQKGGGAVWPEKNVQLGEPAISWTELREDFGQSHRVVIAALTINPSGDRDLGGGQGWRMKLIDQGVLQNW